jgi:hypothetical protein
MPASKAQLRDQRPKNPVGRPTKYTAKMPEALVAYYTDAADLIKDKSMGELKDQFTFLPTLVRFALSIEVTEQSLQNWARKHPAFREALEFCNKMSADMLQQMSLNGVWSPSQSQFVLKVNHGWVDKVEIDSTVRVVLDELQKGSV